jgi:methylglyoxal synthase
VRHAAHREAASGAIDAPVRALLRLAVLHDVAIACNRRSADLIITSRMLDGDDQEADRPA